MKITDKEFMALLSEVIKKLLVMIGPDATFSKLQQIPGIRVEKDGTVTEVTTDPRLIIHQLKDKFLELSGYLVTMTMPSLETYAEQFSSIAIPVLPQENVAHTTPPFETTNQKLITNI